MNYPSGSVHCGRKTSTPAFCVAVVFLLFQRLLDKSHLADGIRQHSRFHWYSQMQYTEGRTGSSMASEQTLLVHHQAMAQQQRRTELELEVEQNREKKGSLDKLLAAEQQMAGAGR